MKINNFDDLVDNVRYVMMAVDAFDLECSLYISINNGDGYLVINPPNTEGLKYLDDIVCDMELRPLSEEERINYVLSNKRDYEDMAYMFLLCFVEEST